MSFLFTLNPKNWGLRGKERQIALAHATLSGEALDRRLFEIRHMGIQTPADEKQFRIDAMRLDNKYGRLSDKDFAYNCLQLDFPNKRTTEYRQAMLDHRLEFGEIEELEYDRLCLDLVHRNHETREYRLDLAAVNLKHGQLSETEYEKECATIREEPWVKILEASVKYDDEGGSQLGFSFDWNLFFIQDLVSKGYRGSSHEEVVETWFEQTCQDVFSTDPDYIMPDTVDPDRIV